MSDFEPTQNQPEANPVTTESLNPYSHQQKTREAMKKPIPYHLLAFGLSVILLAGAFAGFVSYVIAKNTTQNITVSPIAIRSTSASSGASVSTVSIPSIISKVDKSIVDISTQGYQNNGIFGYSSFSAAGSGMILSSNGEILTNNHVIQGATAIKVSIYGSPKTYPAKVIGTNPVDDVAVIQAIGAPKLTPIAFGNSTSLVPGDTVIAIGNALDLSGSPTVTQGIVSALSRSLSIQGDFGSTEHLKNLIQTDAPINPGNSGGPLLNASGLVVGMNTAGAMSTANGVNAQSIGFAEPINQVLIDTRAITANPQPNHLPQFQSSHPGYLGIQVQADTPAINAQLSYPGTLQGVLVVGVVPGSAAYTAGLISGDVITGINNIPTPNVITLSKILHNKNAGSTISITWFDGLQSNTAAVTLLSAP
jgi:S1-C subfamily serine protease